MVDSQAIEWVSLPASEFTLGDDQIIEAAPRHRLFLPAFQIGKYPVTNRQYDGFVAAGGYHEPRYWTEAGWKWRTMRGSEQPAYRRELHFSHPTQPVVGVSWYEAAAFCEWMSEQEGRRVRLPSEGEWEKAARGADEPRRFPWGENFELGLCNTAEMAFGLPTPVDQFPKGVSPFGVWDMAGNVFEWTVSKWGKNWQELAFPYPFSEEGGRNDREGTWARVMRGGSWFNSYREGMCARRARYLPGSRGSNIGFRAAADLMDSKSNPDESGH